jgi:hypothetical protein
MLPVLAYNNKVSLLQKDDYFIKITYLIESKRDLLLEKQKKLKHITKNNEYLTEVRNDYIKYNNYIINQKRDQLIALGLLKRYVKDLRKSGELSENNIEDARHEQQKIINELNMLKTNINLLVRETN